MSIWARFLVTIKSTALWRPGVRRPGVGKPTRKKKKKAVEADAGARGRQDVSASIRSSPDGQDEAIDTPNVLLRRLGAKILSLNPAF